MTCMPKIESRKIPTVLKSITQVIGSSLLIGLFSYVSIPLPFTPVPIVAQATLVLLLGVLLGSKKAASSVALFIAQGAAGLPVFAGGAFGVATLLGPRGGYLIGYLLAAYAAGKLMEVAGKKTILNAFMSMYAGNVIIYLCGSFGLSYFVGGAKALSLGVLPFVIGDLIKIGLSLSFLKLIRWPQK
jgi:biotin transport system substrate-specific component